jgi:ribosomal protein S18 acetylase RimI-like enzyme
MNIQIRDELLPADRTALEQIVRSCKFFRDEEIAVAIELIDERLRKGDASEYRFLIALNGERVVGYCCYGLIPCTVHSYDLYWIVVDPTMHRGGIGRKLVVAAEDRIRKLGGKRIYIDTSNQPRYEPTHHFYSSCGYRVEATLRDFYAPGDNKVVFCKLLQ